MVILKKALITKIRLIIKFMTLKPEKQTIVIHILPNISRSKGNQPMKFGQLIDHNIRNIFVTKSYTNVMERLFTDPFLKDQS